MKLLVVNAYVRENAGDAALLSVLLTQLKGEFPKATLAIAGMEDPAVRADFEDVKNLGSIRRYTSVESLNVVHRWLRRLLVFAVGGVWFRGPKMLWPTLTNLLPAEVAAELKNIFTADAVVSLGGGYLNGKNNLGGDLNVYYLLLPVRLAERLGKPVVFAPQSYGPFGNMRQAHWARTTLNKTNLIMVREQTSMDLLTKLGVRPELLYKTVDSGFALQVPDQADAISRFGITKGTKVVGMTARRWLPPKQQTAYEKALAKTIDYIQSTYKMQVILIPQVTSPFQADDDRIVEKRIAGFCDPKNQPIVVDELLSHTALKTMYSKLDFLIGTRFHSVIFGLISGVPSIAIEYEHKTGGIMHDLELDDWVRKIDAVTAKDLCALFDKLAADPKAYLAQLNKGLPAYIAKANTTPRLIRQVIDGRAIPTTKSQAPPR